MRIIKRFIRDKNRGISTKLFAKACGISQAHLLDVFDYNTQPLTEYVQRRVSKGYNAWLNGEIAIMQNRDNTKFIAYRPEAKPRYGRTAALTVVNGEIKVKLGIKNLADYSEESLSESLERG